MTLEDIKHILIMADRIGSDKDIPEGTRYIQLSETLVEEMIEVLDEEIYG